MKKSGLPYGEEIQDYYNEGVIVDMSKVSFPGCKTLEDNYKAALVYLRNTGFDVTYDFSEATYQQKVAALKAYLESSVAVNIPDLNETVVAVLFSTVDIKVEDSLSVFNDLELLAFNTDHFETILEWWKFTASLPLYAIKRLDSEKIGLSFEEDSLLQSPKAEFNCVNFLNVIKVPAYDKLFAFTNELEPQMYTVFTDDNEPLLEALKNLSFVVMLDAMCTQSPEDFIKILEEITFGRNSD